MADERIAAGARRAFVAAVLLLATLYAVALAPAPAAAAGPQTAAYEAMLAEAARLQERRREHLQRREALAGVLDRLEERILRARDQIRAQEDEAALLSEEALRLGRQLQERALALHAWRERLLRQVGGMLRASRVESLDAVSRARLRALAPALLQRLQQEEAAAEGLRRRLEAAQAEARAVARRAAGLEETLARTRALRFRARSAHQYVLVEAERAALRREAVLVRIELARDAVAGELTVAAAGPARVGWARSAARPAILAPHEAPSLAVTGARTRLQARAAGGGAPDFAQAPSPRPGPPGPQLVRATPGGLPLVATVMPARGEVASSFGEAGGESGRLGRGIVIESESGGTVIAPRAGRVAFAGPFKGFGLLLIIDHGNEYHTLLSGLSRLDVPLGRRVRTGEPVGALASGGTSPRLYVELRRSGQPIDPVPWLAGHEQKVRG